MSDRTVSPPLRVTETHRSPHTLRAPSALSCKSYSPAIVSKLWTTCLLGGHGRRPVAHLPSHTGEGNHFPTKKSFSCETTFPFFIEPLMSRWRVRRRSPRGLLGTGRRRPGFRRRIEPRGARALPGPASVGEPAHCRSSHMMRPQHLPPGMSVDLQLGFCSWSRLLRTRASRPSRAQTSAPAFVSPSLRARACFGTVFSLPPSHPATLNRIYIHVYHPTTVLDLSRSVSLSASDLYLVPSALSKRGPVPPVSLFFSFLLRCYPFTPFCDVDVTFLLCGLTLRLCQSNRLYIPLVPLSASKWTRTGGMRPDN